LERLECSSATIGPGRRASYSSTASNTAPPEAGRRVSFAPRSRRSPEVGELRLRWRRARPRSTAQRSVELERDHRQRGGHPRLEPRTRHRRLGLMASVVIGRHTLTRRAVQACLDAADLARISHAIATSRIRKYRRTRKEESPVSRAFQRWARLGSNIPAQRGFLRAEVRTTVRTVRAHMTRSAQGKSRAYRAASPGANGILTRIRVPLPGSLVTSSDLSRRRCDRRGPPGPIRHPDRAPDPIVLDLHERISVLAGKRASPVELKQPEPSRASVSFVSRFRQFATPASLSVPRTIRPTSSSIVTPVANLLL
jgi:hypothetical protein